MIEPRTMRRWMVAAAVAALAASWTAALARTPQGHYATFGSDDLVINDPKTGLRWQRGFAPTNRNFLEATSYCGALQLDSETGFRVPTYKELLTLVDEDFQTLFENGQLKFRYIDPQAFGDTPINRTFWSSTRAPGEPNRLLGITFASGSTETHEDGNSIAVRCVKTYP